MKSLIQGLVYGILVVGLFGSLSFGLVYIDWKREYGNEHDVKAKVLKVQKLQEGKYMFHLIHTDAGIFCIKGDPYKGNPHLFDIVKQDSVYEFTICGERKYKNIVNIKVKKIRIL